MFVALQATLAYSAPRADIEMPAGVAGKVHCHADGADYPTNSFQFDYDHKIWRSEVPSGAGSSLVIYNVKTGLLKDGHCYVVAEQDGKVQSCQAQEYAPPGRVLISQAVKSQSGVVIDGVTCDVYAGTGVFVPFTSMRTFVAVDSSDASHIVRIWAPDTSVASNYTCDYSDWTAGPPTIPPVPPECGKLQTAPSARPHALRIQAGGFAGPVD